MSQQADRDRFYSLLERLSVKVGGPRQLSSSSRRAGWPSHGVYFFFEEGELRTSGEPIVVRVGTHALRLTSRSTLWGRLAQHRGAVVGSHPGAGNHRASVFRLHVGAALIQRGDVDELPLASWLSPQPDATLREHEKRVELAVSNHIGRMPLLWLDVPSSDDGSSDRAIVETTSIALLSNVGGGGDGASSGWLGRSASSPNVARSGLWNVRDVHEPYDPKALDIIEHYVDAQAAAV